MVSQIFKIDVPVTFLWELLDLTCKKTENAYIVTKESFKRAVLLGAIEPFLEKIKPYYHASKQHYIESVKNYKKFITIIRQISRYHGLLYSSKIYYMKSTYEIQYLLYYINPIL
jgi:hypothetical protein